MVTQLVNYHGAWNNAILQIRRDNPKVCLDLLKISRYNDWVKHTGTNPLEGVDKDDRKGCQAPSEDEAWSPLVESLPDGVGITEGDFTESTEAPPKAPLVQAHPVPLPEAEVILGAKVDVNPSPPPDVDVVLPPLPPLDAELVPPLPPPEREESTICLE